MLSPAPISDNLRYSSNAIVAYTVTIQLILIASLLVNAFWHPSGVEDVERKYCILSFMTFCMILLVTTALYRIAGVLKGE